MKSEEGDLFGGKGSEEEYSVTSSSEEEEEEVEKPEEVRVNITWWLLQCDSSLVHVLHFY